MIDPAHDTVPMTPAKASSLDEHPAASSVKLYPSKQVLKQGWVYRKVAMISAWRPRWAILFWYADRQMKELHLFDHRERATLGGKPRRILEIPDPQSSTNLRDCPKPKTRFHMRLHNQPIRRHFLDFNCYLFPFDVILGKSKWTVAVQTKKEVDGWAEALSFGFSGADPVNQSAATLFDSEPARSKPIIRVFQKTAADDDDDDDDCISIRTTNTEALSLCDSQILSCEELNELKTGHVKSGDASSVKNQETALSADEPWNQRYQDLVALHAGHSEAVLQQDLRISTCIGDFSEVVYSQGVRIIDGLHQTSQRSWIKGQILFYLAGHYDAAGSALGEDVSEQASPDLSNFAEVEAAIRRTGQEVLHINALSESTNLVHTTLMAVLDYKGFRMVAYALMPLDSDTLCLDLSSMNATRTDRKALGVLDEIGKCLNLADHPVLVPDNDEIVRCRLPACVEVHRTDSDQYYVVNVCNLFPVDISGCLKDGGRSTVSSCVLHPGNASPPVQKPEQINSQDCSKRLRPEFVRSNPQPLSPDSLSAHAVDSNLFDKHVHQASEELTNKTIPQFVRRLDEMELIVGRGKDLTDYMHASGINMRYLGRIARLTNLPYLKEHTIIEMVARAFKWHLRKTLQESILNFGKVGAVHVESQLRDQVQKILSNVERVDPKFWKDILIPEVEIRFGYTLSVREANSLRMSTLLEAIQDQCGLKLSAGKAPEVECFVPRIKTVNGAAMHEVVCRNEEDLHIYRLARHLATQGPKRKLGSNDDTAHRFNRLATYYIESERYSEALAYSTAAYHLSTHSRAAMAFITLNILKAKAALGQGDDADPLAEDSMACIMRTVGPNHPLCLAVLRDLGELYDRSRQPDKALGYLERMVSTSARILGHHHIQTAQARLKTGEALLDHKKVDLGKRYLDEAYQVFQSQKAHEFVADTAVLLSKAYQVRGDIPGALLRLGQARNIYERLFGCNHPKSAQTYRMTVDLHLLDQPFVMTAEVRQNTAFALEYLEKLFKYYRTSAEEERQDQLGLVTGQILRLKTRLLVNQSHREVIKRLEASTERPEAWQVKEAIVKMLHVSPANFFDEVIHNVDSDDPNALKDLLVIVDLMEQKG